MTEENKNVVPGLPSQAALIQQLPNLSSLQQIAATPAVTVTAQLQELVQGAPAIAVAAPAAPLAAVISAPPVAAQPAVAPAPVAHA